MSWPRLALALLVIVGLAAGAAYVFWTRPLLDEAALVELEREVDEAYVEARRVSCPRDVLRGEASEGDGTAVLREALAADGRFAACFALIEARSDEVDDALVWTANNDEDQPVGEAAGVDSPPVATGWEPMPSGRTASASRLSVEVDALVACEGLDHVVEAALQHASVCTPLPLGDEPASITPFVRVARGLALLARERIRQGHVREGFELLLDVVRLGDDLVRGRPALVGAMVGLAVRGIALVQLGGLTATELAWQPGDLESLERQSLVLVRTQSSPERWPADDGLTMVREGLEQRGWHPPAAVASELNPALPLGLSPEESELLLAGVAAWQPRLRAVCAGLPTREACVRAFEREAHAARGAAAADSPYVPLRLDHGALRRAAYRDEILPILPYLHHAAISEARVRALPVLFVHRRLAREGCPDASALGAAIASLPLAEGFGGAFSVLSSAQAARPLEVSAPAWLDPTSGSSGPVRLPVLDLYCPAFPMAGASPSDAVDATADTIDDAPHR